MTDTVVAADAPVPVADDAHRRRGPATVRFLDWPRTSRVLPWAIALFLYSLWVVPVDAVTLPVDLGVDSKLDRLLLGIVVGIWLLVLLCAPKALRPQPVRSALTGALLLWLAVLALGLILRVEPLSATGDLVNGAKTYSLIISYALIFWVVATSLRARELPALLDGALIVACIAAVGVVIQYRTGVNWFYRVADLVPGFSVTELPETRLNARSAINGPTGHGLAVCTILAMLLPWALLRVLDAPDRRRRALYALAGLVLLVGMISTQRKSSVVVAAVGALVVVGARPRHALRLLPLGVVGVVAMQIASPGALSGLRYQFSNLTTSGSTTGRTADYNAVQPDILSNLLMGRGIGTFPPAKYRFLDNQFLGQAVTTGVIGVAVYLLLIGVAIALLIGVIRRGSRASAQVATAVLGGLAAYLTAGLLFDALGFRQVPYLVFAFLAFAAILSAHTRASAPTTVQV